MCVSYHAIKIVNALWTRCRWGATLIAYRRDRLLARGGRRIADWSDLLQPELRGQVAMTESARDFLAASLKAAAGNSGTTAAAAVGFNSSAAALARMGLGEKECVGAARALWQQVRLFSNRDHIRAFTAGDVMAVVGWSQDIITLAERSNSVEVCVTVFCCFNFYASIDAQIVKNGSLVPTHPLAGGDACKWHVAVRRCVGGAAGRSGRPHAGACCFVSCLK